MRLVEFFSSDWKQPTEVKSGTEWNIKTAPGYLQALKADPWRGYWKSKQSLSQAISALRQPRRCLDLEARRHRWGMGAVTWIAVRARCARVAGTSAPGRGARVLSPERPELGP